MSTEGQRARPRTLLLLCSVPHASAPPVLRSSAVPRQHECTMYPTVSFLSLLLCVYRPSPMKSAHRKCFYRGKPQCFSRSRRIMLQLSATGRPPAHGSPACGRTLWDHQRGRHQERQRPPMIIHAKVNKMYDFVRTAHTTTAACGAALHLL